MLDCLGDVSFPGSFLVRLLADLMCIYPRKMEKLLHSLALLCYVIAIGQLWHGVERKFLLQIINEMQHKACHHLIKTSSCEKCLLPFVKTSPWIWAYGILHFMYDSGFPCGLRVLAVSQLKERFCKETISPWPVSQAHDSKWPAFIKLYYWAAWSFFGLGDGVTLCPDFWMVLKLFINLEAFYLHGSQPGLSSLGGNKGCRDRRAVGVLLL